MYRTGGTAELIWRCGDGSGQHQPGVLPRDQGHKWGPHLHIGELTCLRDLRANPVQQRGGSFIPWQYLQFPSQSNIAAWAELAEFPGGVRRATLVHFMLLT